MANELLEVIDFGVRILIPVFVGILSFFWAEVKEARRKNENMQADLSKIREEFVSLETLRFTEERIINSFDKRLNDMADKLNTKLDVMVQLMRKE